MFKKFSKDDVHSRSNIKSSVQRGLKTKFVGQFPLLEPVMDDIVPKKSQAVLFKCEDKVQLFEIDVQVDRGAIKFVMGGANIMCPGLTSKGAKLPEENIEAGSFVIVYAEGKENAMAIGKLIMSTDDIKAINKNIGIELIHFLGDGLWHFSADLKKLLTLITQQMNGIRKIQELSQQELEYNISESASWHAQYSDTSYIYIGGLPFELKEEDIITIFSQYGVPTAIKLVRDKDTGESKGFCYLEYEDQRSTVLLVDNFNGIKLKNRPIKVDHCYYKPFTSENPEEMEKERQYQERMKILLQDEESSTAEENSVGQKALELNNSPDVVADDFADPMADYIKNKKLSKAEEISLNQREKRKASDENHDASRRRRHHHHHHHHQSRHSPET